jgi:uncharacterized membrane protein YesL
VACSGVHFTLKFIIIIIVTIIVIIIIIIIIIIISAANFDVTLIPNIYIRLLTNASDFKSRVCVGQVNHRHAE